MGTAPPLSMHFQMPSRIVNSFDTTQEHVTRHERLNDLVKRFSGGNPIEFIKSFENGWSELKIDFEQKDENQCGNLWLQFLWLPLNALDFRVIDNETRDVIKQYSQHYNAEHKREILDGKCSTGVKVIASLGYPS